MGVWSFNISDYVIRYVCYKHKQKHIKMIQKLDGSEASMLPLLRDYSNILLGQRTKRNITELQEFSVGRGIADLFIIEKDISKLKKRKNLNLKAITSLGQDIGTTTTAGVIPANVIKRSVAIEAKVRDWRKGLKQAMRYKSFADKSYLAVYESYINAPLESIDVFKALNIGLIGVSDEGITIHYSPIANSVDEKKRLLASERAYSIIDDAQDSFVVRNQLVAGGVPT